MERILNESQLTNKKVPKSPVQQQQRPPPLNNTDHKLNDTSEHRPVMSPVAPPSASSSFSRNKTIVKSKVNTHYLPKKGGGNSSRKVMLRSTANH